MEAVREAVDAQTGGRDLGDGQILCMTHFVQPAVDPHSGEPVLDPKARRAPLTHGPNDAGNPHGISSEGMCYECWSELRRGGFYACPIHGIQPIAKRDTDGEHCCPVCGKTSTEVAGEVSAALEARAPAVRQRVEEEDRAWIESMARVPNDGLERQSGVLENPVGAFKDLEPQAPAPANRARDDGPDPQAPGRGLHGGGREGHGHPGTGALLHRPTRD